MVRKGWKELSVDGGIHKHILSIVNASVFSTVASINLIKLLDDGASIFEWCRDVFFIYILGIITVICILKNIHKWNALIYAILGIGTIFGNDIGNYSGAVFIVFSVYILKNQILNIILVSIVIISVVAKNMLFGFAITNAVNQLIIYGFVFLIYFFTIRADMRKLDNPILTFPNVYLLPNEKKLIRLLYLGHTRQEIYSIMNKSKNTVTGYQNAIMGKCHAKTFEECLLRLGKSVKIDVIGNVDNK